MGIAAGICWASGLLISVLVTAAMKRLSPKFGLIDRPAARKVHQIPTPLGGGIALWSAVVVTVGGGLLVFWGVDMRWWSLPSVLSHLTVHVDGVMLRSRLVILVLSLATVAMVVGLIDDKRGLSAAIRLIIQIGLVCVLIHQGVRLTLIEPFSNFWISSALTVLWIVGLTNAFNFLDNMDGLSCGVAAIAASLFFVLMVLIDSLFVAGLLVVLVGALSGFLFFNWSPASIFMGDAGSNFVGFLIGSITVLSTFARPNLPEITIAAPICVLAVPIYDSLTVILIRLKQRRSPFQPDRNHFSHRLVELGMNPRSAVLTIYLVTLSTGLSALLLYPLSDMVPGLAAGVVVAQVGCLLGIVAILETTARRATNGKPKEEQIPDIAEATETRNHSSSRVTSKLG